MIDLIIDLRRCPFCGADKISVMDSPNAGEVWVECDVCCGTGPGAFTLEKAIEGWNRRSYEHMYH